MRAMNRLMAIGCLAVSVTGACQCADEPADTAAAGASEAAETAPPAAAVAPTPPAATPGEPAAGPELTSSAWTVTMVHRDDGSMVRSNATSPPRLVFTTEPEGSGYRLEGSTGCVALGGSYRPEGTDGIAIASALGDTSRDCAPDVLEMADEISMALVSASSYAIRGEVLTIQFEGGFIMAEVDR